MLEPVFCGEIDLGLESQGKSKLTIVSRSLPGCIWIKWACSRSVYKYTCRENVERGSRVWRNADTTDAARYSGRDSGRGKGAEEKETSGGWCTRVNSLQCRSVNSIIHVAKLAFQLSDPSASKARKRVHLLSFFLSLFFCKHLSSLPSKIFPEKLGVTMTILNIGNALRGFRDFAN